MACAIPAPTPSVDHSDAPPAFPGAVLVAAAHLVGAQHGCPLPLTAYCPPFDLRQLRRLIVRGKALPVREVVGRHYVDPTQFFRTLAVNGVIPADLPAADRQRKMAESAMAYALSLPLWSEEAQLMRLAFANDTPLPIPYFAEFAGRSSFFTFFQSGLKAWRHGRQTAVVPSEFALFLRQQTGL